MTMKPKAARFLAKALAVVLAFGTCQFPAHADNALTLTPKVTENATVTVDGGKITVTDTDANNDVWNSKVLFETNKTLVPGQEYKISFDLSGANGIGEFFLCKGENIDSRYDETFTSEEGSRSITFKATGDKLYVGMQVGNLSEGKSVNAVIEDICELEKSAAPNLIQTANCDATVENGKVVAVDTSDNNDVWNSKLLYDAGVELEIGKTYEIAFNLSGENGVGELFVCKSKDLNDRYDGTFVNAPGSHKVHFTAVSTKLYIGMQMGNIGKGNSVGFTLNSVDPYVDMSYFTTLYTITKKDGALLVSATDNSDNSDIWNSTVLVNIYQNMVPGQKYEISFELSGDNGVGEFFICKSANLNDRYDSTFTNASGLNTVVFTAEGTDAYLGMQLGDVGLGNAVYAKVTSFAPYDAADGGKKNVRVAQNCDYDVSRDVTQNPVDPSDRDSSRKDTTVITGTDTNDNNDIWTSRLMYFFGNVLEIGKEYVAKINLSGSTEKMGEFFFLKSDNMDDRYSFDNTAGDHTVVFTAESEALYAGMQFGNVGNGEDFVVTITDLFEKPFDTQYTDNCTAEFDRGSVTLTDAGDNNDVWNSKAVYDTGITLKPNTKYTVTFTLEGDDGVGEFFFLKDDNIDNRYSFDNTAGTHTITFTTDDNGTGEDIELYMGIQCGNIGDGNSVTVSDISVVETPVDDWNYIEIEIMD